MGKQRAYTLIEILSVLVLLTLLCRLLFFPAQKYRQKLEVDHLKIMLPEVVEFARLQAVSWGVPVSICPVDNEGVVAQYWTFRWALIYGDDCSVTTPAIQVFHLADLPGRLVFTNFKRLTRLTFAENGYTLENGRFEYFGADESEKRLAWIVNVAGRLRLVQGPTDLV